MYINSHKTVANLREICKFMSLDSQRVLYHIENTSIITILSHLTLIVCELWALKSYRYAGLPGYVSDKSLVILEQSTCTHSTGCIHMCLLFFAAELLRNKMLTYKRQYQTFMCSLTCISRYTLFQEMLIMPCWNPFLFSESNSHTLNSNSGFKATMNHSYL
jgi:hypothetical protein